MNRDQFQVQMNRLIECFGKGAYGTERCALIWRAVDGLSIDWFKRAIENFIGSSRQAPLVVDFKDAASQERERAWEIQKHEPPAPGAIWNPHPRCRLCTDNGVYICTNPNRPGLWAFRCHCERGCADVRKAIPQFKQDHITQGFVYCDMTRYRATALEAVQA